MSNLMCHDKDRSKASCRIGFSSRIAYSDFANYTVVQHVTDACHQGHLRWVVILSKINCDLFLPAAYKKKSLFFLKIKYFTISRFKRYKCEYLLCFPFGAIHKRRRRCRGRKGSEIGLNCWWIVKVS